jgi:mannose-6-phosphate isomerase
VNSPLYFHPIAKERVWGGRKLASLLGKLLPDVTPIGEIWEIVDRDDAQSIVAGCDFSGLSLHDLWQKHRVDIFGIDSVNHPAARFPFLVKLLDAKETLSVQVHPPASIAQKLKGEPKTEVWYFLDCQKDAEIYAGLKHGVTKEDFRKSLKEGGIENLLHRLPVHKDQSIFIQSGRLHAIGAGNVIIEIQQNSDTTYRVYDWNRIGLDAQPRQLHISESLESIDFHDFEPSLSDSQSFNIADCPYFTVEKIQITSKKEIRLPGRFSMVVSVKNSVTCGGISFGIGDFFIIPANGTGLEVFPTGYEATILVCTLPI